MKWPSRRSPRVRRDLVAQQLGKREVLEHRHDVGEGLVERQDVDVARLLIAPMQSVEQRMRRLVRDDVVRQTGEHHAAERLVVGLGAHLGKIAEQQRDLLGTVIGVGLA